MIKVLDSRGMQACDRQAIEHYHVPGVVLMENAGVQALEVLLDHLEDPPTSTAVLCGRGNNGGDGLVVARHLHNTGCDVVVILLGDADSLSPDAALNYRIVQAMGIPVLSFADERQWAAEAPDLGAFDCLVDGILGTGLRGPARGLAAVAIDAVNASGTPVMALDLPSGLSADSGALPGPCVTADLTVTFGAPKMCHVLAPATTLCGDLTVVDIGIPQDVIEAAEPSLWLPTPEAVRGKLPPRRPDEHKGDAGTVLVVGGALGTAGAVVLAARAALRGGAGLVHVACPETVYAPVASQLTEALVHPLPVDDDGGLGESARARLDGLVAAADAVALGPGIGKAQSTAGLVRELAAGCSRPLVIDADALNLLVGSVDRLAAAPAPRVLTPHPGEMARLLECSTAEVQDDRVRAVTSLAQRSGAVVVLKGQRSLTVSPGGVPVVNATGNPGMATGGSGDVLTGLVAAFLSQGRDAHEATWLATWLHGRAGDLAAESHGEAPMTAGDLVELLPDALAEAAGE